MRGCAAPRGPLPPQPAFYQHPRRGRTAKFAQRRRGVRVTFVGRPFFTALPCLLPDWRRSHLGPSPDTWAGLLEARRAARRLAGGASLRDRAAHTQRTPQGWPELRTVGRPSTPSGFLSWWGPSPGARRPRPTSPRPLGPRVSLSVSGSLPTNVTCTRRRGENRPRPARVQRGS
jgi:hypothetical protein